MKSYDFFSLQELISGLNFHGRRPRLAGLGAIGVKAALPSLAPSNPEHVGGPEMVRHRLSPTARPAIADRRNQPLAAALFPAAKKPAPLPMHGRRSRW